MNIQSELVDEATDDDLGLNLVDESPILNGLSYATFRLVRLVLALTCEVAILPVCVLVAMSGFLTMWWAFISVLSIGGPDMWAKEFAIPAGQVSAEPIKLWLMIHPYLVLPVAVFLLVFFFAQAMALGIPYRWKTGVPGSGAVRCSSCHKAIVAAMTCSECHAVRPLRLVELVVWGFSACVTLLWGIHDVTLGLLALSNNGK